MVDRMIEFSDAIEEICVDILVTPDEVYENDEEFSVNISSLDSVVIVSEPSIITIMIFDDDTGTIMVISSL